LVDARKEVSNYESHINDVNIQNGQLKQELDQVKIDKSRLEEEMKNVEVENKYLKSELKTGKSNIPWNNLDHQNNSTLQQNAEVHRVDYNHGYSGRMRDDFYDTRGYIHTSLNNQSNSSSFHSASVPRNNSSRDTGSISHPDEPKFRLPYFNGRGDFQGFWAIFQIGIRKFNWDSEKQIEHLMCSLKDDALAFVTKLPFHTQSNIQALYTALNQRYSDYLLPEQYRENLNQVKKVAKETLVEYASRVEEMVNKAYPQLNPPQLVTTLTIENILRGLPDQALSYEVRTKRPKTIDETLQLITWHECCKNGSKRQVNVRQIEEDFDDDTTLSNIRKVGNDKKYVTEDRLTEMNKQIVSNLTGEINKLAAALQQNKGRDNQSTGVKKARYSDLTCYSCHEKGHTSRVCPLNKEKNGNKRQNHADKNRFANDSQGKNKDRNLDSENNSLNY